jgi:hypothetical protein
VFIKIIFQMDFILMKLIKFYILAIPDVKNVQLQGILVNKIVLLVLIYILVIIQKQEIALMKKIKITEKENMLTIQVYLNHVMKLVNYVLQEKMILLIIVMFVKMIIILLEQVKIVLMFNQNILI